MISFSLSFIRSLSLLLSHPSTEEENKNAASGIYVFGSRDAHSRHVTRDISRRDARGLPDNKLFFPTAASSHLSAYLPNRLFPSRLSTFSHGNTDIEKMEEEEEQDERGSSTRID